MGHGPLDFCRVKANFSARVPKNLSGPRPPEEVVSARLKKVRVPKLEEFIIPRVFCLKTDQDGEGSGVENKLLGSQNLVLFAEEKVWRREIVAKFASGATMLIDLWSGETI